MPPTAVSAEPAFVVQAVPPRCHRFLGSVVRCWFTSPRRDPAGTSPRQPGGVTRGVQQRHPRRSPTTTPGSTGRLRGINDGARALQAIVIAPKFMAGKPRDLHPEFLEGHLVQFGLVHGVIDHDDLQIAPGRDGARARERLTKRWHGVVNVDSASDVGARKKRELGVTCAHAPNSPSPRHRRRRHSTGSLGATRAASGTRLPRRCAARAPGTGESRRRRRTCGS